MKFVTVFLTLFFTLIFSALPAFAGVQVFDQGNNIGVFSQIDCQANSGLKCTKIGNKAELSLYSTSVANPSPVTRHGFKWTPGVATQATSATPAATSVYLVQMTIPAGITLTGVGILNAATVGTNKYIVALFDNTGAPLVTSALAGVTTAGASAYQQVPFTATFKTLKSSTYWIGLYVNGTTDRYYAVPSIGQSGGLAGSVGSQTFGTVAAITLPTTFTADVGPIAYTY